MTTQFFYDSIMSTAKLVDINAEQPVETEILLADYDAPVFKIVKSVMEHSITQKYIMNGKLTVEGFIKLCIYYQPPENQPLSVISQKIPFNKQIEVSGDVQDAVIMVSGQCQYVNTRPQNPTRIDVRGAYLFGIKAFAPVGYKTVTAAKGQSVCCDTRQIEYFYLSGQNTRRFSLEEEISLPENLLKVISVDCFAAAPSASAYSDKLTARGDITANVYYTSRDSGEISRYVHTFAYNQIVDMEGIKENHIVRTDVHIANFALAQNSETNKFTAKMTVNVDACAFAKTEVIAVSDAFSRNYEYEKTTQTAFVDSNITMFEKAVPVKLNITAGAFVPQYTVFEFSPVKSYFEISKTAVKVKLTAHVMGINAHNEYECFSAEEDMVLPWLENCRRYDEICVTARVAGYTFAKNEDGVQINAACSVQGFVIEKSPCSLLTDFRENIESLLEKGNEALIIYYGQKGERIFDIAKNHRADPQDIMTENDLSTGTLTAPQMLFIPTFEE